MRILLDDNYNENSKEIDGKNFRTSLLELKSNSQRYQRTKPIIDFLEKQAEMNKITVNELLGIVTKQYNYHTDKRVSSQHIGESLIKFEKPDNMMDITKTC